MDIEKLIERLRQERASLERDFPGVNALVFDVAADALTTLQAREATLIRALGSIVNMPAIRVAREETGFEMQDIAREALATSGPSA